MKKILNLLFLLFFILNNVSSAAQKTSINFELNGNGISENSKNPFRKFIGEWTLKADSWTQNWGADTETIKIPNHHTVSTSINTDNSLLSIIDGPSPNGHIFWSYNPVTKAVHHLSSFGAFRAGQGAGLIDKNGNLQLTLTFEGEPKGTYRKYTYQWVNEHEYQLKSIQFDSTHQPTGLFYGGNFIKMNQAQTSKNTQAIKSLLAILDDNNALMDNKLNIFSEDFIHMAPNHEVIQHKVALKAYLEEQRSYGYSDMEHQIIELQPFEDIIIMRGQVVGTFHPSNGNPPFAFKTKNLFVFKWIDQQLKIWKIIYNQTPIK